MEQRMNQEREMTTSDKKITGKEQQGNDGLTPAQATEQTSQIRRSTPDQPGRKEDTTPGGRNDTQKEDTDTVRENTRSNTATPESGKTR